jgi:hypothetical protein
MSSTRRRLTSANALKLSIVVSGGAMMTLYILLSEYVKEWQLKITTDYLISLIKEKSAALIRAHQCNPWSNST